WRKGNDEVDFVVSRGRDVVAIEVKSGRPGKAAGLAAFCRVYPRARPLIIGGGGLALEEFFAAAPGPWFENR
ncbi:MAG: AAA family ATPase, partial [Planctomycetia bacterium]